MRDFGNSEVSAGKLSFGNQNVVNVVSGGGTGDGGGGGDGGTVTANASDITSGTLDNARLPQTIVVAGNLESTAGFLKGNGALLRDIDASSIATGVLDAARLPPDILVGDIDASSITTGTLSTDRLPPDITIAGTLTALSLIGNANASLVTTGTLSTDRLPPDITIAGTLTATTLVGNANASLVTTGTLSTDRLPPDITIAGTMEASELVGNGAGLQNIDASNVASGTLNNARLPADVSVQTLDLAGVGDVKTRFDTFMESSTRLYVSSTKGSDDPAVDGRSWDKPLASIREACDRALAGTTIFVETGTYTENNPIRVRANVAIVGDNLRRVLIYAQNPRVDLFHLNNSCYIAGLRFLNLRRPAFGAAFPCALADATVQNGSVSAVELLYSPPEPYVEGPPDVFVESPDTGIDGTRAQITAVLDPQTLRLVGLTITNPGAGYASRPHVSIPPPLAVRPIVTASPYIQNCSAITGPFDLFGQLVPVTTPLPYSEDALNIDPEGGGGGARVDGRCCSAFSPLRSFVTDSYTQVSQYGFGFLIFGLNAYMQAVSTFTTFCVYSFKAVDGGTCNISTSVTDFGTYALVAKGYWPEPITTGELAQSYRATIAVQVTEGGSGYVAPPTVVVISNGETTATAIAILDQNGSVEAVVVTSQGAGFEIAPTITFQNAEGDDTGTGAEAVANLIGNSTIRIRNVQGRKPDVGSVSLFRGIWYRITGATPVATGEYDLATFPAFYAGDAEDPVDIYVGSMVSTGQHVIEYGGSGGTYNALPQFGGVPDPSKEIIEYAPGKVFYSLADHTGNIKVGSSFAVEQATGTVTLNTDVFNISGLNSLGPFKRNGIAQGVALVEVSPNPTLLSSQGAPDAVPTQSAVIAYVEPRSLPPAGNANEALTKASSTDFVTAWQAVVLASEKNAPDGVAVLDAASRIVGDGSIIGNIDASAVAFGSLDNARLPADITISGNVTAHSVIANANASLVTSGILDNARLPQDIAVAGTIAANTFVGNASATNLTSGTLQNARLPSNIEISGNVTAHSIIANVDASLVTSGTLSTQRLPDDITIAGNVTAHSITANANASLVTSGTLDTQRLPEDIIISGNLTASNIIGNANATLITTGTLSNDRLPANITVSGDVTANAFVGDGSGLTGLPVPYISNVVVTDASWQPTTATSVSTGGGFVLINGKDFEDMVVTYFGTSLTPSPETTKVSSTQLRSVVPALEPESYDVCVSTGAIAEGGGLVGVLRTAVLPQGLVVAPEGIQQVWTSADIPIVVIKDVSFSVSLASDGSTATYAPASALPDGTSLGTNGVLTGIIAGNSGAATTYTFSVSATSAGVATERTFVLTARPI